MTNQDLSWWLAKIKCSGNTLLTQQQVQNNTKQNSYIKQIYIRFLRLYSFTVYLVLCQCKKAIFSSKTDKQRSE